MTTKNRQTCLSAEMLRQLSHDELSPAELEDVEEHVSGCVRCRNLLEVAQSDPEWRDEIVAILRAPLESPQAVGDPDGGGGERESLESILRLLGPTDDPHMLGRIGPYEVVGVIGRGGMGVVFKAYEGALNRFVAIKMLLPHLAASGAARKRFAREGQAAAAVIDDNVMPIYSVAEWQGVPYLVTQYSRGATLQKRIQDQGPLELKEILRIGMQTARGLAAAHAQGLVHRDVKPSNILLDGTVERALLTDFGLARAVDDASITRTGIIAGTPQYMSPEQARGGSINARSDLFGLGCVLYAMCTGRPPFRADSSYAILRMITDDEPRSIRELNPDIPEWLCLLISRLMAKSPDVRFGGALEVADLLERCLAHVQQPTSVPLPASLVRHATDPRSIFTLPRIGVIAMLGIIGMTLLQIVLWQAAEAPDEVDRKRATTGIRSYFPGMTQEIADAILDWVDADDEQRPFGAESETYRQLHSSYSPSNRPLTHMEELLCIRGVTPKLVYGADTNFNGIIDGGEDGSSDTALGWAGLIRANPTEPSVRKGAVLSAVDRVLFALAPDNPRVGKFAELDTDQDGRLSLAEFGVGRKAKYGAKWFGRRDANHDGYLSPAEFVPLSASSVARKQPAATLDGKAINHKNARLVVEAYVAAALDGDPARAQLFAKGKPAEAKQIATLPRQLNLQQLDIESVYVNDPANPLKALATSEAVKLEEKQPNGQRDGFLVLTLTMSDEGWFVTDIDFESEEGADSELTRFLKSHTKAIGLPPFEDSAVQVGAPKGELNSQPNGAEKPTARATPKLPKLPDEAYTKTGIHCQKFREEDAKRPGGKLMGDVVESQRGKDPLVLGMRVASDAKWNIGGQARVELVVRNASASDVKFPQTPRADSGLSVVAIDKDGKEHQAEIAQFRGRLTLHHLLLPRAHMVRVKAFTLRFDPEKRGVSEPGVAAFHLPPGDYTLRCKWNDARPEVAHAGDWTGELVSVEHQFTLTAAPAVSEK